MLSWWCMLPYRESITCDILKSKGYITKEAKRHQPFFKMYGLLPFSLFVCQWINFTGITLTTDNRIRGEHFKYTKGEPSIKDKSINVNKIVFQFEVLLLMLLEFLLSSFCPKICFLKYFAQIPFASLWSDYQPLRELTVTLL